MSLAIWIFVGLLVVAIILLIAAIWIMARVSGRVIAERNATVRCLLALEEIEERTRGQEGPLRVVHQLAMRPMKEIRETGLDGIERAEWMEEY